MNQSTSFAHWASKCASICTFNKNRYYLFLINFLLTLTVSANVWGAEKTYTHQFTTKPSIGNNTLSTITWGVEATNLNNYNNGYAGVQFGTSKANGSITLTSVNAWGEQSNTSYTGYTNVKYVYVWLNAGSGTPTATVTIGGKAASKSGTVSKNTAANNDYKKTSKLTFTPTSGGNTGVIVITASTSSKAGYIAAIEVVCETPAASCTPITPSLSYTPSSLSVGGTANPTLTGNSGNGSVTYSSSNTSVATVNASTGIVTAKAAGTTTITATIAENNGYCEGTATAQITVTPDPYTVTLNAGPGTCAASVTEASAGAGVELPTPTLNGCDEWTFAGWAEESIDAETTDEPTLVTDNPYKPSGDITLYAVYKRIEDGVGSSTPTNVTKVYSGANDADLKFSTGSSSNNLVNNDGYTAGNVNVTFTTGTNSNNSYYDGSVVRFYAGSSLIVTPLNDVTITQVEFVRSTSSSNNTGTISTDQLTASQSNSTTNTNVFTGSATSAVTFKNSAQCRFSVLRITYTSSSGTTTNYHSTPECTTKTSVTLNPNGGKFTSTPDGWTKEGNKLIKEVEGSITLPTPIHDGCYDFAGWYDAQTDGNKIGDEYEPEEDIELFAYWTESTTLFRAMIDDENIPTVEGFAIEIGLNEDEMDKVSDALETTCGNKVYLFRTLVQGYKEVQWTVTIDGTQETIAVQNDGDVPYFVMPKANVLISAELIECDEMDAPDVTATSTNNSITLSWDPITGAKEYNVFIFYDYGNSHLQDDADVVIDGTNYTFTNLDAEHTYTYIVQAQTEIGTCFTETKGEITTASATCTVTYDANGGKGTITDDTEYTNGATVTVLGNFGEFTNEGCAFTGWNTKKDGTGNDYKHNETFTITTNTTLYAQWCKAYWKLVTDKSELENDTRIVIAAKDYNYALSTDQKTNNRGQAEITKKYNTITFEADVQTLSLVGLQDNKFALYTGSGYLYAAGSGSNNYLKTGVSDGNDDWSIGFSIDGTATILAQGTNTNKELKYNAGSDLFSCYGSTNSQKDVVIYKEVCVQDQYNVNEPKLTNATAANTNPTTVASNATSLILNYSANTRYLLPETITVKMGGVELLSGTDYTWNKEIGALTITVTGFYGDIDVKIVAEEDPCYGFAMSEVTATSTSNSITLSWSAVDGATGYNLTLNPGEFSVSTGKNSHTFEGLSPKTEYTWEVQAVKDGANFHCEASKTGSTTTQKETFTVSWSVNGNVTSTESVVDGEKIKNYPSDPSAPSGCSTKVFVGWTKQPIPTETNETPTLYTELKDIPAITANTPLYAVWADVEGGSGNGEEEKKVTLDFTSNSSWKFPTSKTTTSSTYTNANGISITLGGVTSNGWAWYDNGDYFLYGQSGCYIQFPAFDFTVTKFVTKGRTDASSKVTQNVFVEDEAVSIQTTGTTGENTYEIASEYQEAGNVYLLKVTSAHNAQVTQIDIYGITSSITTAYTTLCDECTPSESLVLAANASTADLDINGKATITFSTTGGNGGAITYAANPKTGVTWDNGTATFTKAGDYTITALQEKNGEYCPTSSNTVNVTITAIPHLYFVTEPAPTTIEFDPVECGGNTRLEDKKSVSVQAYNLAAAVTVTVTGPYKIARTSGATLNEYDTKLTLDKNQEGHINGNYDDVYILSFPPAGSSEPTEGTLIFTTTNGNGLTVSLSTPTITCTPCTLTFNDRGIKTTQEYYAGTEVPEPATPMGVCGEYEFDGWALAKVESSSTTYEKVDFPYIMPANNQTVLHAVYRYTEGPTNEYELVTEIESGKNYVIAAYDQSNGDFALTNQESNTDGKFNSELVECDANNIITTDNSNIIWTVTGNDEDGYEFYNSAVQKYIEMYRYDGKSLLRLVDNCVNPFYVNIEKDLNNDVTVDITSQVDVTYKVFSFYERLFNVYKSCDYNIYFYEQTATPLYTTTPDCHPSVTLTSDGEVYVTATNGRGIMAATPLTLTTTDLAPNTEIAISSNSGDIYFSTERNTNFAMVAANQPQKSLTLTTNEGGELETPLYIHYKPSSDGDGIPAEVVVTADVSTHNPPFTAQKTIHVRNMPIEFVIATKAGDTWYALPANMNGATNPAAVVIEVDETTMTAVAPNTTPYTLWPVATINSEETDRYKGYGERLRFAAVNNGNKGLWANNSLDGTTINNSAAITAVGSTAGAAYEWKVTTAVVDGNWQYTLYSDQDKNKNHLCYSMHLANPAWGTYASNEAMYQLYFLPIKAETTPFDYQVIEWYPNKVLIQTSATFSALTAKIAGQAIANVQYTSKDANQYEVTGLPLLENPAKALTLEFVVADATHTGIHTIPVMLSGGNHSVSTLAIGKGIYNYTDLVVRDGATLTIDGEFLSDNTFYDVTIYPTAKISVPEGKQLSVHRMTFLGGISEIYNGSTYELNKYGVPQLSLEGTLGKTVTTMDYIMRVNLDQMYQVGVPYDVNLNEITYWDGSAIKLGDELYVSAYDGQARANLDMNKTWRWEVNFDEKVLKAGIGYTISAEPQVEGDAYSILRMPMKNNIASGNTEESKQVPVIAYANQHSVQIADNHKGWNYLSNPYMTAISGGDADSKILLGALEYKDGSWELVNTGYRYVTIPYNDGEDYYQQKFSEATLLPFKSFFLQIAENGNLSFALASRQAAPARYLQQAADSREVEFEILLANVTRSDNMGLLISEEYTPDYEINADLEKMTGTMSVYTIYNGYNLAYNALSPLNAEEQIPVGFVVPANGEYTFDLKEHGTYDRVEHIYLIDRETDAMVDLLEEAYSFYTAEKKNNNRFAITVILKSEQSGGDVTTDMGEVDIHSKQPQKFFYDSKLYILRDGKIYSATGHEIQTINQ